MTTKTIHCLLGLLLLATHTLAQDVIRGRCVAVSDGDTIKVLATGRELLRIRVAWIDCPELGQAFGRCAMQLMRTLVHCFIDLRSSLMLSLQSVNKTLEIGFS